MAAKKVRNVWPLNSGDKTQIMVMGCGNIAGTMIHVTTHGDLQRCKDKCVPS